MYFYYAIIAMSVCAYLQSVNTNYSYKISVCVYLHVELMKYICKFVHNSCYLFVYYKDFLYL